MNNSPAQIAGALLLEWATGLEHRSQTSRVYDRQEASSSDYHFLIQSASNVPPGRAGVEAVASVNGKKIEESYRLYTVLDLWRFPFYRKARLKSLPSTTDCPAR